MGDYSEGCLMMIDGCLIKSKPQKSFQKKISFLYNFFMKLQQKLKCFLKSVKNKFGKKKKKKKSTSDRQTFFFMIKVKKLHLYHRLLACMH